MWKAALAVLAASLIFPLLVSRAAAPDSTSAQLLASEGVVVGALPGGSSELPEELQDLSREQRIEAMLKLLEQQRPAVVRQRTICLAAQGEGDSMCDAAAEVARMEPCLAAGDCPAVDAWEEAMGEMGVRPAPQAMTRANIRPSIRIEPLELEKD